jgi:glycosyltransferase involved in cell wall biosynthesis
MRNGKQPARPPLLVFSDDWQRHPSSCQHLIRALLPEYRVWWINTIGMRPPRLNWSTLSRGAGKLRTWLRTSKAGASRSTNPQVADPTMWPTFRGAGRKVNRVLLERQLLPLIQSMGHPPVAITTVPITADLMGVLPVARWVYYCVDDFGQWPGLDQATMAAMEKQVVNRCDRLISVSETLCDRLEQLGKPAHLLTHGVDLEHWCNGHDAAQFDFELEEPLVVFWGLIDQRLDVEVVRAVANSMSRGSLLLVGPQLDADPALWKLPRVRHIPAIPYEQLPALASRATVLVMPYADLPVTRAMQPLKLKEYLATGKPVVVRDLPATAEWAGCLDIAGTAEEFARGVLRRIEGGLPASQAVARARLSAESWQAKARSFEQLALMPEVMVDCRERVAS